MMLIQNYAFLMGNGLALYVNFIILKRIYICIFMYIFFSNVIIYNIYIYIYFKFIAYKN